VRKIGKRIDESLRPEDDERRTGVGADPDEEPEPPAPEPFRMRTIPAKWSNGDDVKVMLDEDDEVDWRLTPFANPYALEKIGGPLVQKIGSIAEKLASAAGTGLGGPPRERPRQEMTGKPAPTQETEEPEPNGAAKKGTWESFD
jgi:hypothetical protein